MQGFFVELFVSVQECDATKAEMNYQCWYKKIISDQPAKFHSAGHNHHFLLFWLIPVIY